MSLGKDSPDRAVVRIKWAHDKFLGQSLAVQSLVTIVIIIVFLFSLNFSYHVSILGSENMIHIITGLIEFWG